MTDKDFSDLVTKYEALETPRWAVEAVLDVELMTHCVVDPCVGRGVLAEAAVRRGHTVYSFDVHDWGYPGTIVKDYIGLMTPLVRGATVLMNPPFSRAVDFVTHSLQLGARKVICFQRLSWWESRERSGFFDKHPPARIHTCGSRATCMRFDIPTDGDGNYFDPETGRKYAGTPTAHAWYVWEHGHGGTIARRIYR